MTTESWALLSVLLLPLLAISIWSMVLARRPRGNPSLTKLQTQLDALEERHEALRGQHLSLRGRVYALWGKKPADDEAQETAAVPDDLPLADARLSKDQVRFRLLREGRLNSRFHGSK